MNYRIFVSKKAAYTIEAESLKKEIVANLAINTLKELKLINTYDVFNADEQDIALLKTKVVSEAVTDEVFDTLELDPNKSYIIYECLPGQYDQRADSAEQCLMLLNNKKDVVIKSGRIVELTGTLTKTEIDKIKNYLINPVEMREKDLNVLEYNEDVEIEPVETVKGFINYSEEEIENYRNELALAMSKQDLLHIQKYFKDEEHREPTLTEIKVLDTYWSDHCRHTTFETILQNVKIEEGKLQADIQKAYDLYTSLRTSVHNNKKVMTLMDMATIGGKHLRKIGKLDDMEISDEINACSIEIDVDVNGTNEKWLLMFKNETHNHPTEIEPFGGASTCIGGAIRDPLSGRSYVYQAMRISGAGDINASIEETLPNKLPQSRISKGAAHGYSSYGNQIGLATTYVNEIYNDGYVAKRMEVGAVVGAAPKDWVMRKQPATKDIVVLLGGATGRDGVGGATGSSKEHNETSLTKCSSEVQKGNAPIERKLQRLFRNKKATSLIKKANDFGAGGVSVAIGEIADGISINLDAVPTKYTGLNGTELAISESQERMAVLIEPQYFEEFKQYAYDENLEATLVAEVTEERRLVLSFKGQKIVDISRDFLDTNGVRQIQDVIMKANTETANPFTNTTIKKSLKEDFLINLQQQNTASQKGLVEMFDASIGKSTVLMPYGGKYQLSKSEGSVQKLPVLGFTNTVSMMTYGYNPEVSIYSPYLGASYSVVEALARICALGGDYKKTRLTNQEYFERLHTEPSKWGQPMQAMLGLVEAQIAFETPSIGGKDSMSGTFNDISVPPTLITFAVGTAEAKDIVSTEFKQTSSYIYLVNHNPKDSGVPDYEQLKKNFETIHELMQDNKILAASTVKFGGIAETIANMSFGNKIGVNINTNVDLFKLRIGSIILEAETMIEDPKLILLGTTTEENTIIINKETIAIEEAIEAWESRYQKIYPTTVDKDKKNITTPTYATASRVKASKTIEKPKVIIPVFPGTNCEYDCKQAFEREGGEVEIYVFNNTNVQSIQKSLKELSEKISKAQILMLAGGFSSGDEPDGSGKFIANVLSNESINNAVQTLLNNDGLILGICNGFQALIKSGLLPYGDITKLNSDSPTLFRNDINRHVSKIATTKITSNKSPWLADIEVNEVHKIAMSHGEGKFVISETNAKELFENGQVATQYTDLEGNPTMNGEYNINGSSYAIEGITSKDGRIFGKMGHSERYEEGLFKNIEGNAEQNIFRNGINYFKK
ncbi:MAG: phosphoribosylformylglycinamidine synthase [Erysipelotrichaceae bacterium]